MALYASMMSSRARRSTVCRRWPSPTCPTCSAWSSSIRRHARPASSPSSAAMCGSPTMPNATNPRACCCCVVRAPATCSCRGCCRAPGCQTSTVAALKYVVNGLPRNSPKTRDLAGSSPCRRPCTAMWAWRSSRTTTRWPPDLPANGRRCFPAAITSNCSAPVRSTPRPISRVPSRSPQSWACPWWRPIRCSSCARTILSPTRRASVSPRASC